MRFLIALIALASPLLAEKARSTSTLISEVTSIAPGKPFTVALKLDHPAGWHSYYLNSGGTELPPSITWKLPQGAAAGHIQWPTPEVKDGFDGKSFIYGGSPVFLIEITPPPTLPAGSTFAFSAHAMWQICEQLCVDEYADFSMSLPVAAEAVIDPAQALLFKKARNSLPKTLPGQISFDVSPHPSSADSMLLTLRGLSERPSDFIPDQAYLQSISESGEITQIDDGFAIRLDRKKTDFIGEPIPQGNAVSGILLGNPNYLVPETSVSAPDPENLAFGKFLKVLGGMFVGGLILNLMPCVFPVIGLKIMGFVKQAGASRRAVALHGLSFTSGVLASFAVLSGILFAARSAAIRDGSAFVGWGYQLQDPHVVVILLLLMFVLGLNMFGLFEIGTSATSVGGNLQHKTGHAGSFLSGVLATIVATPCSAPFLGTAIGVAMTLPSLQFFSGFAAMAIGLALPYLVLSVFPEWVKNLPRPGAWMESFKQAMSFLLFGTSGYLLWFYSAQIGQENLIRPIFGLCIIAVGAWIYGRWHLPHRSRTTRITALALGFAFVTSGVVLTLPPKPDQLWEPWSESKTEELLEKGTPVYIDFTAQWCITCQLNKKIAYTEKVIDLAKRKGVVFLKADKTRRPSPEIDGAIQKLGRNAIPVNVLIIPGKEPILTPEILTPNILTELFSRIPDSEKD